jgi:integrase
MPEKAKKSAPVNRGKKKIRHFDPRLESKIAQPHVIRRQLVRERLKPGSQTQYESGARVLARAIRHMRGLGDPTTRTQIELTIMTMTKAEFFRFLQRKREQEQASAEVNRSAALQILLENGITDSFLRDDDVMAACEGVEAAYGPLRVDKGVVTLPMFRQLLKSVEQRPEVRNAIRLLFAFSLRICELQALKVGDMVPDDEGRNLLILRVTKTRRQKESQVSEKTALSSPEIRLCYARQCQGKRHGSAMFSPGIRDRVSKAINAAAARFKWPSDLDYTSHCMRIGGAVRIQAEVDAEKTARRSAQSKGVFKHYIRRNAQRRSRK